MNIRVRANRRNRLVGIAGIAAIIVACSLSACSSAEPSAPPAARDSDIGEAFTSADGLTVTVTERVCGITGVGKDAPEFTAAGEYCTVGVTVDNATGDSLDLTPLKLSGWAGQTEYFADYWAGTAADGGLQQTIPNGDTLRSTLFFDVPSGTVLDAVTIVSPWAGLSKVQVKF